ncbi:hypothetical protein FA95DRAFT_1525503 [Auriscalpium vulgare]|uniref:Uncharacterized protein n=1 Tax=Auriscalpium vulgare TaxID=40419 RepID=A0ACB8RF77_9AGAM|nr:hypothetical protein FA95DRAFT_1525503 [Auriscalpium vulgare]
MSELEPLDPDYVARVLSSPPFVTVSGVCNLRDLGQHPTEPGKAGRRTRPGFAYRSAELGSITPEGQAQIRDLGISTIFDLRSDTEILKYNSPTPVIPSAQIVHIPVFQKQDYSPERMAQRFQLYAQGNVEAFLQLYSEILDAGGPTFGTILRHVRDKPQSSFLFHCTAGKDRTGVMAALLLLLAGADDQFIAEDYALTRIGREPARAIVMERLEKEPIFAGNREAALNMLSSRPETMLAFLKLLEERYGGVEAYVKKYCELNDDDIGTIRRNLTTLPS